MKKKNVVEIQYKEIIERIITRREELEITQRTLAVKLNLSPNGYFKVEKGITKLDLKRLLEIAIVLNVNPQYFFEDV